MQGSTADILSSIIKSGAVDNAVICFTRYGNVMCSRGSVIPLFIDQIKSGKPITITNPEMTRFLMNLDEAVELVRFAFMNANPGDLFIQKADASTIGDLAKGVQQSVVRAPCPSERPRASTTFSISALDMPIALIGYAALSVERHTTLLTPASIAACRTLSVPSTFVLTACMGKNSQEGTCLSAAAWKI